MSEADFIRRKASEYRQEKNTDISLCPLARRWLYVLRHDEEGDNGDGAFYGGYGADADDWMEIPCVLLPVIWCYCFFDTFHVAKLPEEIREFEDQDCWDTVVAFVKSDPLKRFEEKKTLAGVLILLAALYTMIYGVFLPFFRWSEELRLVRMALTAIPPAVIAVLLFMVGRNILQKEQDRKDAEAGIAETDAPDVEETALEEGNVEQLVEAVLGAEAEKEAEETAEAEEVEAENADKAEETEKTEIKETA